MKHAEKGFIVPTILISVLMISFIALSVMNLAVTTNTIVARESDRVNAQFTADAGLDIAIRNLNVNSAYTGTPETTLYQDAVVRSTYQISITNGATPDRRTITSVSRVYSPAGSATPRVTRTYEVDVQAVTSGTSATSVVTGVGGLVLDNNARITGGDVVVNGTISMSNQSQIGTQTNPVNVRVAHLACPTNPDATYPQVCTTGQPIFMQNNARIYGDVRATNQTNGTGMSNPGLIPNQTVAPITLPAYDRSTFVVAQTRNATDSGIRCPSNNGNVTWPANVRIIGDINMNNNCTINITGNVWISGNINTGNQGNIVIANSLGATRPVIMIDGPAGFTLANNGRITPNASGTGAEIRTFWSNSACSPNCTSLTGTALANSQNVMTIDLGNNGNAANSVFIAQWSRVRVSNNGALGAVSGQSILLSNQAVINFTTSVPGSSNLTQTWVKRGYLRVY